MVLPVRLVLLDPLVPLVRLEPLVPDVWLVRLLDVLPVVVVVFDATRFSRSRALLIEDVRLVLPDDVFSLAIRFENDSSG